MNFKYKLKRKLESAQAINIVLIGKHQQKLPTQAWQHVLTTLKYLQQQTAICLWIEAQTALLNFEHAHDLRQHPMCTFDEMPYLNLDTAIVIGGDGTMIGAARALAHLNIPLIGINSGRLGFIADIELNQLKEQLQAIIQGQFTMESRRILKAQVKRNHETIFEGLAINDVVVARVGYAGMIELSIDIDGIYMCKQRADGMIVATGTGSTAYALSVGGPVVHPKVGAMLMAPIAPHSLSNRPILIPEQSKISMQVGNKPAILNCDTQTFNELKQNDIVHIALSDLSFDLIHPLNYDYYAVLREKLHWQQSETN